MKLSVDGCSKGNPSIFVIGGVLCDCQGVVLAAFGFFLGHQSILYTKLMAMFEALDLVIQPGFNVLEVESNSATMVSQANSHCSIQWEYVYLLGQNRTLSFDPSIVIRHVFLEATSVTDCFMANWTCIHQARQQSSTLEILLLVYLAFYIQMLSSSHMFDIAFVLLILLLFICSCLFQEVLAHVPLLIFLSFLLFILEIGVRPNPPSLWWIKLKKNEMQTMMILQQQEFNSHIFLFI